MADTHAPLASHPLAASAVEAWLAGIAAVDPTVLVRRAVRQGWLDDWFGSRDRPRPIRVLALGKAAPRMVWGLVEGNVPFSGLGVAPRGARVPLIDTMEWLAGEHPVPGAGSLAAGARVLEWVEALPEGEPVLALLSGGASAIAEAPDGIDGAELERRWRGLLDEGLPIERMNARRAAWSRLKGGRLGRRLLERTPRVRVWLLADTDPATAPATVGSGPLWLGEGEGGAIPHRVLAGNGEAVAAAGLRLATLGHTVYRHGRRVAGPLQDEVDAFVEAAARLPGDRVALVGGGEATLRLPAGHPPGGRNQHAALLAAQAMRARGIDGVFLAAATDGVDGAGAAGAWCLPADGDGPEAGDAIARFDAHGHLARRGRLLPADPTGTNANDVWVLVRPGTGG